MTSDAEGHQRRRAASTSTLAASSSCLAPRASGWPLIAASTNACNVTGAPGGRTAPAAATLRAGRPPGADALPAPGPANNASPRKALAHQRGNASRPGVNIRRPDPTGPGINISTDITYPNQLQLQQSPRIDACATRHFNRFAFSRRHSALFRQRKRLTFKSPFGFKDNAMDICKPAAKTQAQAVPRPTALQVDEGHFDD
ncbi:hypothetical protein [Achromobacter insuavis]|uniref:hypothetical protein n=1 Tax=Achromobacter insuavis TaxID=1287735 RepID=UPI0013C2B0E0|nr:hypothetical protein [Achromobacter insuavis]